MWDCIATPRLADNTGRCCWWSFAGAKNDQPPPAAHNPLLSAPGHGPVHGVVEGEKRSHPVCNKLFTCEKQTSICTREGWCANESVLKAVDRRMYHGDHGVAEREKVTEGERDTDTGRQECLVA